MLFPKAKHNKANPQPSILLAKALSLFGPSGENWITKTGSDHRDASFIYEGKILSVDDATEKIAELLREDPTQLPQITKDFKLLAEADTFCSIGAIYNINTKNQDLAEKYLAAAISADYRKHINIPHNSDSNNLNYRGKPCRCAKCLGLDDASDIITYNNDDLSDDMEEREASFSVIKKWFNKAITLAQRDGN